MAETTMVTLSQYGKQFDLHADARKCQIGACVSQEGKPLGYFSRKFNAAQMLYPVGDKEMLSITEGLKHFKTMLKGQRITVHTDYLNLTFANTEYTSDRMLRQRFLL